MAVLGEVVGLIYVRRCVMVVWEQRVLKAVRRGKLLAGVPGGGNRGAPGEPSESHVGA